MENRVSQFISINEKKGTPDNPLVSIITPILNGVKYLEAKDIQCKTLFGSLPTQHKAFKFLNYKYGQFPAAEYVKSMVDEIL